MRTFVLLVAFSAQLLGVSANGVAYKMGGSTCDSATTDKTCYATKEGSEACEWCSSAAVGASCYKASDAKSLPSSIFQCKSKVSELAAVVSDCSTQKKDSTCLSSNTDKEKCSWCQSAAVGGTCFTESDAKSLPSSIYDCTYQKVALKSTDCDSVTSEKTCMSTTDKSAGKCSWCASAAVGGSCFIETDAKSLPSSVFQCEYQKVALKATACDSGTSKTCSTLKNGSDACVWCTSAAVGGTCFPESDAKGLPSSVFSCAFPKTYAV